MVNLSRRSFLIGTSAAVAAIALPVVINEIVPLVTDREFIWRRYNEIVVGGIGKPRQMDEVRTVSIFRQNGKLPIHKFAMNSRGSYKWWAPVEESIIVPYKDALRIDIEGGYPCKMDLTYEEKKFDGSIKMYSELH